MWRIFKKLEKSKQKVIKNSFKETDLFERKGRKKVWFGWILWHINHCRLFNAKSSLYICIKYIGFGLVGFYGILNIAG